MPVSAELTRACSWCGEPFDLPSEKSPRQRCYTCAPQAPGGRVREPKKLLPYSNIVRQKREPGAPV